MINQRSQPVRPSSPGTIDQGPSAHVAIVQGVYVDLIERGTKTIESRLSIHRAIPFGRVQSGDLLLIKQHSGPYRVCVTVGEVWSFELLTRAGLKHLRERFGARIAADSAYWQYKRRARYATLVELLDPCAISQGPALGGRARSGWVTLGSASRPDIARFLPMGVSQAVRGNLARTHTRRASA